MPYPGGYGVTVLEAGSYTPSLTQLQNTAFHNGYYEVDGALWMQIQVATGWTAAAGTGAVVYGLPPGWQFDTARLAAGTNSVTAAQSLGLGRWWDQGGGPKTLLAYYGSATAFAVNDNGGGVFNLTQNTTSDYVSFNLRIPVKRL